MFEKVIQFGARIVSIAKGIRRPMTYLVLVCLGAFVMMWRAIPEDMGKVLEMSVGGGILIAVLMAAPTAIIIACAILTVQWGKARLAVDPNYLDEPSTHE